MGLKISISPWIQLVPGGAPPEAWAGYGSTVVLVLGSPGDINI